MRRPWAIIASRSGHSCSVTSISLCAPCVVRPITRMIRSWSAANTRSASRISVIWSASRRSKVSSTGAGIGLAQHQLAHVVAPQHDVQHVRRVARSSLSRSGATASSGVASSASAASCASSSRFCR